ncbi:MAG: N-acetyl-gamma-glutamyl-phosphate reductase [Rickettsiales bacterium]
MKKINVAILGASGYTGAELLRLLPLHPQVEIAALTAETQAGQKMADVFPHLAHMGFPDLVTIEQVDFSKIDLVFCCLPHGTTQAVLSKLPEHVRIVDLSADFRLRDETSYAEWYGHAHQASALQKEAVYGLTEHYRDQVKTARLVANPGCYPTSALLPLVPLLKAKAISEEGIIIDAKSGVTGAGRSVKRNLLFCEIDEGMSAYSVGHHRHMPEIEQEMSIAAGTAITINFTPHLIPIRRGMISTIYVKLNKTLDDARKVLTDAYASEYFVHVLDKGVMPSTHSVRGTNYCQMNVFKGRTDKDMIIVSAIDNLGKGASTQAIQNMNVMFGFDETEVLRATAI